MDFPRHRTQDAMGRQRARWQREAVDLEHHQIERRHGDLRIRDEARRRRLTASMAEIGQQVPVIVVAEGARFVLIDGYLRTEVLAKLGRDSVAATVWSLSEAEALLAQHHLSMSSPTALEEGWLLVRLHEQGLSEDELGRRLCRSKSWVSRRLALVGELGVQTQQKVREGIVPAHAAMKYLVPLARANRTQCEALVAGLGHQRVSDREVAALYAGWRRADPTGRQRLVADPRLYLRAWRTEAAPETTHQEPPLCKDLASLSAIAWRTRQRIATEGLGADAAYHRTDLDAAWRAAEGAFEALRAAWKEACPNAGSNNESRHPQAA